MINKEKNDLSAKKRFSNDYQLEPGFKSLHTLIQHGCSFYWSGVCIKPGEKKIKSNKLSTFRWRISSCVTFEHLPLKTHLQCLSIWMNKSLTIVLFLRILPDLKQFPIAQPVSESLWVRIPSSTEMFSFLFHAHHRIKISSFTIAD